MVRGTDTLESMNADHFLPVGRDSVLSHHRLEAPGLADAAERPTESLAHDRAGDAPLGRDLLVAPVLEEVPEDQDLVLLAAPAHGHHQLLELLVPHETTEDRRRGPSRLPQHITVRGEGLLSQPVPLVPSPEAPIPEYDAFEDCPDPGAELGETVTLEIAELDRGLELAVLDQIRDILLPAERLAVSCLGLSL